MMPLLKVKSARVLILVTLSCAKSAPLFELINGAVRTPLTFTLFSVAVPVLVKLVPIAAS